MRNLSDQVSQGAAQDRALRMMNDNDCRRRRRKRGEVGREGKGKKEEVRCGGKKGGVKGGKGV